MKKNRFIMYEIIYKNMNEFGKNEITIDEFKRILQNFRVSPKFWFVIIKELKEMYGINSNCKKITLKGG